MKHYMASCLLTVLAVSLAAGETIFEFTKGKTFLNASVPAADRAVKTFPEKDGLRADYVKSAKDTWPVVNIDGLQLANRNWTGYGELVITVTNLSPDYSPSLNVVIRGHNKVYSTNCWVRANSQSKLKVKLADAAKKVDLKDISMIQLAFNRPAKDFSIRFQSIELEKTVKVENQNDMVSRVYDLRKDMVLKRGLQTHGACRIEVKPDGSLISYTEKYKPGMDRWPGVQLAGEGNGAMCNGDFSTKTHLVAELEELPDSQGIGLGLSFKDGNQKTFWHGIGTMGNGKVQVDRLIFDMGVDLKNIARLNLGFYMPSFPVAFKINKLQLEFRPDAIQRDVLEKLQSLEKEKLAPQDRKRVAELLARLNSLYAKVKGEQARRGDINAFTEAVLSSRKEIHEIRRRAGNAVMLSVIPSGEYGVGVADSMTSVFLDNAGFTVRPAQNVELEMAGNEKESFQVVIAGNKKELKNATVSISKLTGPGNAEIPASVSLVGHAKTVLPTYAAEYVGWYPDFLIEYQKKSDVKPNENVPFWVRLATPVNAVPGLYRGTVTVSADNIKSYTFPVAVKVYDFSLPNGSPIASSNSFHLAAMKNLYQIKDEKLWEKVRDELIYQAADYKISLDYLWSGPYTSLAGDGSYPILKQLNDRGQLNSFCMINSTVLPKDIIAVGNNPDHPEVQKLIDRSLKHIGYWSGVAKKYGVWEKIYFFGFDESRIDAVANRVFSSLKKAYPDRPVVTTATIPSARMKGIENIDIWVPTADVYRERYELVKELRKMNKKVWWYVCNFPRPPEPTLMLEVPAAVPRLLMGAMTQKYRPEGFLYWAIIVWDARIQSKLGPVSNGPRTNWNPATCNIDNEEGNLFVPGRDYKVLPTIRIENFRDGVEDLWYYRMLETLVKEAKQKKGFDKTLLARAEKALIVPDFLVASTNRYSTDPDALRKTRRELAFCMEQMQKQLKK